MTCKRRTKCVSTQRYSSNALASPKLSRCTSVLVLQVGFVFIISLLITGGCSRAETEISEPRTTENALPESHSASGAFTRVRLSDATPPDMTLHDYNAGCSTSGCHGQLSKTRWVHAPVANGDCNACHQLLGEPSLHEFEPILQDGSVCNSCHSLNDPVEYKHEPYQLGTCGDCHNPHGGSRKNYIITQSIDTLCATCHDKVIVDFPHHPVTQGDCLTCHAAHDSEHEHLLVRNVKELCLGCHQDKDPANKQSAYTTIDNTRFVHDPMVTDGCLACHKHHGSEIPAILAQEPRAGCMSCHEEMIEDLPQAKSTHGAFEGQNACMQCHTPHASEHDGLLVEQSGRVCLSCHDESIELASGASLPNMMELIEESMFVHEPAAYGDCSACHAPHFSAQQSLLRTNYPDRDYAEFDSETYAMCIECHDPILVEQEFTTITGFREGDQNLHHVHIHREKGISCMICHQPHAGQLPKLMREGVAFGPGGWDLPIGFIQTKTGGSCMTGCHEQRWYDNTYSLDEFSRDP